MISRELVKTSLLPLLAAKHLERAAPERGADRRWSLSELGGRFVELSASGASASLTLAFRLVMDAQRQREPVAWVTPAEQSFYPPDVVESGVDLDALVVVRVPDSRASGCAAEKLLRSGAFGLIALDLGREHLPTPLQMRLAGLARKHHTALLCLTEKAPEAPSLGSLVSVRVQSERRRVGPDQFECALRVMKDKRRGPTWAYREVCRGPAGLR